MIFIETTLILQRLESPERTRVEVWIGEMLLRKRIVPFDSLLQEIEAIDKELSEIFDYHPDPYLPSVTRLVENVRARIKNNSSQKLPPQTKRSKKNPQGPRSKEWQK